MKDRVELYSVLAGMMYPTVSGSFVSATVLRDFSHEIDAYTAVGNALTRIEAARHHIEKDPQQAVLTTRMNTLDLDEYEIPSGLESHNLRYRLAERRYMGPRVVTILDDDD